MGGFHPYTFSRIYTFDIHKLHKYINAYRDGDDDGDDDDDAFPAARSRNVVSSDNGGHTGCKWK